MDMNLLQREVAIIIGMNKAAIENWEYNRTAPNLRAWPAALKFLGYDPRPPGRTAGGKLCPHREGLGLSWKEAAELMKVDPSTVSKWERQPDNRHNHISIPKIIGFLGYDPMPKPATPAERPRHSALLLGLTQEQFGQRLGVCQDTVWGWETGRQEPPERVSSDYRLAREPHPPGFRQEQCESK